MTDMTATNILLIFFTLALGCEGAKVSIHPLHLRVSLDPRNITITCKSSTPITGCQFSWWRRDWVNREGPVLDLSMGAESVADLAVVEEKLGYPWYPLLDYSYSGRGLSHGDCGVRFEVAGKKTWMVSCRVKTADTWVYETMDLFGFYDASLSYSQEPNREEIVVEGGEAKVMVKTHGRMDGCEFSLPTEEILNFSNGSSSPDSTGRHLYQGEGLDEGECGLVLKNVAEDDNGLVRSSISKPYPVAHDGRLTSLIVARAPTTPVLTVRNMANNFTATCRVQSSRPAPNFTWFLGDQTILQGDSPGTEDEVWRWPWMAGAWSQTVAVSIPPQDAGKALKCSVTHVSLTEPLEVEEVVVLT